MKKFQDANDWGLTRTEFNTALFGNPIGEFKVTNEYLSSYQITDDAGLDLVFLQLNTAVIQELVGKAYVISQVGGVKPFPTELQKSLRYLAYFITALGLKNGLFEKTANQDVSGSNLNISNDLSGWTIPADNIPSSAWERLENTGIMDYFVKDGVLYLNDDAFKALFKNDAILSTIDFLASDSEVEASKGIYSAAKVNELIAAAVKGGTQNLGQITENTSPDFPTNAELNTLYNSTGLVLDSGTIVDSTNNPAKDFNQIQIVVTTAGTDYVLPETIEFINGAWKYVSARNAVNLLIEQLEEQIQLKADLDKVILKDGSVDFDDGYDPVNDLSPATLKWVKTWIANNPDAIATALADKKVSAANGDINNPRDLSDLPTDFDGFTDEQKRISILASMQDLFRVEQTIAGKVDSEGNASNMNVETDANGKIVYVPKSVADLTPYRTSADQDVIDAKNASDAAAAQVTATEAKAKAEAAQQTADGSQVIASQAMTTATAASTAAGVADSKAEAAQIDANRALRTLTEGYELIGTLLISHQNTIIIDFSKPNDYILISSHQISTEPAPLTIKASFPENIGVSYNLITTSGYYGSASYVPSTKSIQNNDGNDTVAVYRRKEV